MANHLVKLERTGKVSIQQQENKLEVKLASNKDVNQAVASAMKAFEPWANIHAAKARIMFKFKELIEKF